MKNPPVAVSTTGGCRACPLIRRTNIYIQNAECQIGTPSSAWICNNRRMDTPSSRELLTRQEAAEKLRISLTTMSNLLKSQKIYHIRLDRRVLIPAESLDAFVRGERPYQPGSLARPDLVTWPPTPSLLAEDSIEPA